MQTTFKIFDWAGNDKTAYYGTFNSFDGAWEAIYNEFGNLPDAEEWYQEFEVREQP